MPTNYEWGLFFHIVGVFAMAGGWVTLMFALAFMRRCTTVQELRPWARLAYISDKIYPASAFVIAAAGFFMVQEFEIDWGTGWLSTSIGALVVTLILGGFIIFQRVGAIDDEVAQAVDGPIPASLMSKLRDPVMMVTTHSISFGLIAIIFNMTTKPDHMAAGIVTLAAFVLGAATAMPMAMRERT